MTRIITKKAISHFSWDLKDIFLATSIASGAMTLAMLCLPRTISYGPAQASGALPGVREPYSLDTNIKVIDVGVVSTGATTYDFKNSLFYAGKTSVGFGQVPNFERAIPNAAHKILRSFATLESRGIHDIPDWVTETQHIIDKKYGWSLEKDYGDYPVEELSASVVPAHKPSF